MASNDRPIAYGVSSLIGRRATQQDDFLIKEDVFNDGKYFLYGVFDGHGENGDKVSSAAKRLISDMFPRRHKQFKEDPVMTMIYLFQDVAELIDEDVTFDVYLSGTTAAVAVVDLEKSEIVVANLGDCRVVLGQGTLPTPDSTTQTIKPLALTKDHTCADNGERNRIEALGARIAKTPGEEADDAPLRVYKGSLPYPGLVMTRTFGDSSARLVGVISKPEVTIHKMTDIDLRLVLATDGVWDALSNSKVIHLIATQIDAPTASKLLANKSLKYLDKKCIDDNSTNIVVFLKS